MTTACDALCSAGLSLCLDPECSIIGKHREMPLPDRHFHLQSDDNIDLYPQSRTLSDISDLSVASPTEVDTPLIYASNPIFHDRKFMDLAMPRSAQIPIQFAFHPSAITPNFVFETL